MVEEKWHKERGRRFFNGSARTGDQNEAFRDSHRQEDIDSKCRMCGERAETVAHILALCEILTQCQYKNWRHNKVAQALHWEICKKYGLPVSEK